MELRIDPRSAITDYAGKQIADALESIAIARSADIDITNYNQIREIVKLGRAKDFFEIGDQIHTTWSPDGETTYDMPWDVVDFGPATDPDGVVHENAMWLESHYALPAMPFDQCEAFYVAPEEMPAGTYHFMLDTIHSCLNARVSYKFTLTKTIPAKGMLQLGTESNDEIANDLASCRVRVYANGVQADPDEVVEVSQGDDGTDLGKTSTYTQYGIDGLNNTYRLYGYNRWSQSAIRQWLNSDKAIGEWWKQQNPFDRRPRTLALTRGFMAGLSDDFLSITKPVKVTTVLNQRSDIEIGDSETVIDRFFLASMSQEYIAASYAIEGKAFKYWVNVLGTEHTGNTTRKEHIRNMITSNVNTIDVRLRTPVTRTSTSIIGINTVGRLNSIYASNGFGSCPVCVIY